MEEVKGRHHIHLIDWWKMCKPKELGRVGLKLSAEINRTLLAELAWRVINEPNELWSQIIEAKYGRNRLGTNSFQCRQNSFNTLKGFVWSSDVINQQLSGFLIMDRAYDLEGQVVGVKALEEVSL